MQEWHRAASTSTKSAHEYDRYYDFTGCRGALVSRHLHLVTDAEHDEEGEDFCAWVRKGQIATAPLPRTPRTVDGDLLIIGDDGKVLVLPDNERDPQ